VWFVFEKQKKRTSKISKTPDTVKESPVKTEKEFEENSPWARDLLAELDMADTDAGADGEAGGMELILPSPKYEVEEEEQNSRNSSKNHEKRIMKFTLIPSSSNFQKTCNIAGTPGLRSYCVDLGLWETIHIKSESSDISGL